MEMLIVVGVLLIWNVMLTVWMISSDKSQEHLMDCVHTLTKASVIVLEDNLKLKKAAREHITN